MKFQQFNYPNGYKKVFEPAMERINENRPVSPNINPKIHKIDFEKQKNHHDHHNQKEKVLNLFSVDEGFKKGTMFKGLYRPYKNLEPRIIEPNTEKEKLLFDVNKYYFALLEMQLYLDNFPDDHEALKKFNEFRSEYVRAKESFESKFESLDISSNYLNKSPWNWANSSFPWIGGK